MQDFKVRFTCTRLPKVLLRNSKHELSLGVLLDTESMLNIFYLFLCSVFLLKSQNSIIYIEPGLA